MAQVADSTSAQLNPAAEFPLGNSGSFDANLVMDVAGTPYSTNRNSTTTVSVEGGAFAEIVFQCGTVTDSDEVVTFTVQHSIDGGSNFRVAFVTQQFTQAGMSGKTKSYAYYIPRGNSTTKLTQVRVVSSGIGGTTPSFPLDIFLRTFGLGKDRGLENIF